MKAWLATQSRWLKVEQLPAYAHDLNPVELAWGNVKAKELANLCPDTIDEAHTAADAGLMRIGTNEQLCFNFLDHTGLSLSPPCSGSTETCLTLCNSGQTTRAWLRAEPVALLRRPQVALLRRPEVALKGKHRPVDLFAVPVGPGSAGSPTTGR